MALKTTVCNSFEESKSSRSINASAVCIKLCFLHVQITEVITLPTSGIKISKIIIKHNGI